MNDYLTKTVNYYVFHKPIQGSRKLFTDQQLWFQLLRRTVGCSIVLELSLR